MVFCFLIAAAVLELTATFLQPVKFEAEIIALQTCLSKHPEASLLYVEHVWHRWGRNVMQILTEIFISYLVLIFCYCW